MSRGASVPQLPLTAKAFAERAQKVRDEWERMGLFRVHIQTNKQRITITPRGE